MARRKAYRRLDRLGLAERADDPTGDLSLRQRRMLEIARSLATDPVLLILDKPNCKLCHLTTSIITVILP